MKGSPSTRKGCPTLSLKALIWSIEPLWYIFFFAKPIMSVAAPNNIKKSHICACAPSAVHQNKGLMNKRASTQQLDAWSISFDSSTISLWRYCFLLAHFDFFVVDLDRVRIHLHVTFGHLSAFLQGSEGVFSIMCNTSVLFVQFRGLSRCGCGEAVLSTIFIGFQTAGNSNLTLLPFHFWLGLFSLLVTLPKLAGARTQSLRVQK